LTVLLPAIYIPITLVILMTLSYFLQRFIPNIIQSGTRSL